MLFSVASKKITHLYVLLAAVIFELYVMTGKKIDIDVVVFN
jgi:hypothetical protein